MIRSRNQFPEMIDAMGLKVGAEIGVGRGVFSKILLDNSRLDHLFGVDSWAGGYENNLIKARRMLLPFAGRSSIVKGDSVDVSALFADGVFDFIYLDVDPHSYDSTKRDIEAWYPKIRKGGLFCGHDYTRWLPRFGVIEAVDGFEESYGQRVAVTGSGMDIRERHDAASKTGTKRNPGSGKEDVDLHLSWWCIKE
jgi:hypothetical protein